jgi:hypothetical protein
MVLTQKPYNFNSFSKYQEFELEFGVSSTVWQIELGTKLKRVTETKFMIGDEVVIRPYSNFYSPSMGLILNEDRDKPLEDQFI